MPAAKTALGLVLRAAAMAALAGSWHQPDDGPRRPRARLPPPLNPSDDPYAAGIAVTKRLFGKFAPSAGGRASPEKRNETMPQSGFMTIFCLIGLLTTVYFVGGFLDWATEYVPIYIIVGAVALACGAIAKINEYREDRAWRRRRSPGT